MCPMVRRPPAMELALLGFLRQGPQHGYQIHLLLSDPAGLGPIWRLKQSQLYALLTKLEKDGYIWGELEPQAAAARPPRRMYQLTITGQTAYQNWLRTPVNVPRLMRQEFMAKYYFARLEGQAQVKVLIDLQRATCLQWLETLYAEQAAESAFSRVVYRYRLGQMEAALAWLDTCQQELSD